MDNIINRREIAKGVFFSSITDPRFKLNRISVAFLGELSDKNAAVNALVPRILSKANAVCPTPAALSNRLSGLYAASVNDTVGKIGDTQYVGISVTSLDDAYALEGEAITAEATDILINCLFNPVVENGVFSEKTTALEKQSLIDEIEAELNEKRTYARKRAMEILCKNEPAAVNQLGSAESAEKLTAAETFAAYERLKSTAPVEIVCVGCNDFAAAEKKLSEAFGKLTRGEIEKCSSAFSAIKDEAVSETEKMTVTQSKMVIGMKSESVDFPALRIMSKLYGGTTTSKLFMNVREKLSLCYYCWARYTESKGIMLIDCGVESGNIEKAKAEILAQFEDMKNGKFTDEDIEFSKLSVQNDTKSLSDSLSGVFGWYFGHIYRGEIITPEESIERDLAVTRERIIEAAKSMKLDSVYVLTGNGESVEGE